MNTGRPPLPVVCETCGATFLKHQYRIETSNHHFCSRDCQSKARIGKTQSPELRRKKSEKLSGDKAPNWKGGNSRQYKRGYKSEQYKHWRAAVFERDCYTCQDCKRSGGYLTAHHIQSFAEYPALRYEVSNGVTLCEECHSKRDNYYARFRRKGAGV